MTRNFRRGMALLTLWLASAGSGQALNLKLASIAPENSPWGEALNRIAAEWSRLSNGEVEVRVYHNGIAGNEANMLRKLKMGQIQGAVFTSMGAMAIIPQIMTPSYPLFIRDDAELDYVMERLAPLLEKSAAEKNYVLVTWSKAGWIRFFSTEKVVSPRDLKSQRLVSNPDDPTFSEVWQRLGYHQVPVAIPDVLQGLNSGLVTTVWSSPAAVAGYQWFGVAKHMTDLKLAPFLGVLVLTKSAWLSIPAKYRGPFRESARKASRQLDKNILQLEEKALTIMKRNGLSVEGVPPDAEALWQDEFRKGAGLIMGRLFSQDVYDKIKGWLAEYRSR